jgi:dynein heavy chain
MLEAFDYLAKRESIKQAVKKKSVDVLEIFQMELDNTKYEYDNMKKNLGNLNMPIGHGKHSG